MLSRTSRLLLFCLITFAFFFSTAISQDDNPRKVKISEDPNAQNILFKTTVIGSDLADIIWCGKSKESVIVVTEGGIVHYSNNGGLEWKKLKDTFERAGQKVSEDEDIGAVNSLMQSPVDSDLVFFLGSEGVHWYTEDCGRNIKAVDAGRNIKTFQFHPTKRDWVLATAFTVCDEESDKPCKTSQELYLSQDLGSTWTFLIDYVIQFSWAFKNSSFEGIVPEQRIVVTQDLRTKISQRLGAWAEDVHLVLSDDFFKTKKTVLTRGQKFLVDDSFFFVVRVEDEEEQDVSLYVSNSKLNNYDFQVIQLPTKDKLYERSYIILDSSEGQVFLHINHERVKSKYGHIYISDSTGVRFSLSLRNNVRTNDDLSDFESVMGLEGIFFANIYDPQIVGKAKNEWTSNAEVPTEKGSRKGPHAGNKQTNKRTQELDEFKQTRMTFDKGGMWEPVTPPKYDALGERIDCEDKECSLHLHSLSNQNFGPFYSTDNSLGIILSTGNVGKYLSNKEDEISTYLSRDGGLSWFEIKKGSHIYEIGDHGSLIVVADNQKATEYIYYTWNEGISWSKLKVSETPVEIANIIIEPSNTAQKFVLYGRTTTTTEDAKGVIKSRKGVLIGLDFSSLHERYCELPEKPDDPSSDYETWTPGAYLSGSCLMGHQLTYVRRKRQAECFNPQDLDKLYNFKNCQCTEEDWECDLGYERKNNGPCVLSRGKEEPSYEPPEECNGYYSISSGYRKVAGNTCEGGVNHEAIKFRCPSKLLSQRNAIALLGLAVVGIIVWMFMNKREQLIDLIKHITEKLLDLVKHINYKARAGSKKGFAQLNQTELPDGSEDDHDDLAGKLRFVDDDDDNSSSVRTKDTTTTSGKRMTERKGLETASKNIPAVNKPQQGKHQQQQRQLLDDDDDDVAIFDPRK